MILAKTSNIFKIVFKIYGVDAIINLQKNFK